MQNFLECSREGGNVSECIRDRSQRLENGEALNFSPKVTIASFPPQSGGGVGFRLSSQPSWQEIDTLNKIHIVSQSHIYGQ